VPISSVEVQVQGYAPAGLVQTFETIVPIDLTQIFKGFGPLPGVRGNREQTGAWDHVGASRVVELSDGSEAPERITAYEAPHYFAYRVGPFTSPLRFAVSRADGAWWFTDGGDRGTHVRWSYTFQLHGPATPLARLVIAPLWRSYAKRVLALALAAVTAD
jgi:hypothetical protein